MLRTLPPALRPFRSADYRALALALAVALFGAGMWAVAMVYEVMRLGGDALALSAVGAATSIGLIVTALPGGIAADRWPRRWILRGVSAINLAAVGAVVLLDASGSLQIWHLAVAGAVIGAAEGFFFPAYSAILPRVLPEEDLLPANGLEGGMRPILVQAAGPALAGVIVAAASPAHAVLGICICHALALAGLFRLRREVDAREPQIGDPIPVAPVEAESGFSASADSTRPVPDTGSVGVSHRSAVRSVWEDIVEAVRFARSTRWFLGTLLWAVVLVFVFVGPLEVLTPFLLRDRLGLGSAEFGIVLAGAGIGSAVGALVVGNLPLPRRYLTVMMWLWGAPMALFAFYGFATELWQLVVIVAVNGACAAGGNVIWGTLLQRRVPRHMLGRVSSLDFFVSLALMPLSMALAGPLSQVLSLEWIFTAVAVISVMITAIVWAFGRFFVDEIENPLPDGNGTVGATDSGSSRPFA